VQVDAALKLEGPHLAKAHYLSGFLLYRKGNATGAQRELAKALELAPDMAEAHYQLGEIAAAGGNTEQAKKSYARAIELRPAYSDAILALKRLENRTPPTP
jgi:tetratricopeptide (TPR) repeat protein